MGGQPIRVLQKVRSRQLKYINQRFPEDPSWKAPFVCFGCFSLEPTVPTFSTHTFISMYPYTFLLPPSQWMFVDVFYWCVSEGGILVSFFKEREGDSVCMEKRKEKRKGTRKGKNKTDQGRTNPVVSII